MCLETENILPKRVNLPFETYFILEGNRKYDKIYFYAFFRNDNCESHLLCVEVSSILKLEHLQLLFLLFFDSNQRHCIDSSENCTTNKCIFKCIQMLYDLKFCNGFPIGQRTSPVNLNESDIFASLVQHNVIDYNVTSETLTTGQDTGNPMNDSNFFLKYSINFVFLKLIAIFLINIQVVKINLPKIGRVKDFSNQLN